MHSADLPTRILCLMLASLYVHSFNLAEEQQEQPAERPTLPEALRNRMNERQTMERRTGRSSPLAGRYDPIKALERSLFARFNLTPPLRHDALPFDVWSRLVQHTPIGGIDTLDNFQAGLKVEDVFKLDPEQLAQLEEHRRRYETDLGQIESRMQQTLQAYADEILTLRKKYEAQANELLPEAQRREKIALDRIVEAYLETISKEQQQGRVTLTEFLKQYRLKQELQQKGDPAAFQAWYRAAYPTLFAQADHFRKRSEEQASKALEQMQAAVTGENQARLSRALESILLRHRAREGRLPIPQADQAEIKPGATVNEDKPGMSGKTDSGEDF